ncbi:TPA: hypothetical protein DIV55_04290 [Patescibacteria group bacterium]|nr:hypothetical protein [Patescibacteria group bacterium]
MHDNVLNQLQQYKAAITEQLEKVIKDKQAGFAIVNEWGSDTLDRLLEFSKNGKMIRGALLLFSTEMFGRKITAEHMKAAAALELIQSAILIHDDIIDQDALRRGKPAMHTQFQAIGINRKSTNPVQFGISLAICAGDVGFFLAFELLNSLTVSPETKTRITKLVLEEIQLVELAQMQDVFFSATSKQIEETEILKLYQFKTGRYTFSLPLTCAALFTKQPTQIITKITQLGEYLGILFQLKDDELSLFGTSKVTGKPVGTDISRNNKTLYHHYLFVLADSAQKKRLNTVFGNPNLSVKDMAFVQTLVNDLGINNLIRKQKQILERKAREIISTLPVAPLHKEFLIALISYNQNRAK